MSVDKRTVVATAGVAVVVAGTLAAPQFFPQAFADEPQSHLVQTANEIFAPKFDPKSLRKFDIVLDDSVSSEVTHRDTVSKIGFGQRTIVSIVTTPSGTYSSDALGSPYVRYPGIDVTPNRDEWYPHGHVSVGSSTSPRGTYNWSSVTSGSFTYYSSTFTPKRHS